MPQDHERRYEEFSTPTPPQEQPFRPNREEDAKSESERAEAAAIARYLSAAKLPDGAALSGSYRRGEMPGIRFSPETPHIAKIKADLIRRHTQWLAENDTDQFYTHVSNAWRIEKILEFTRDMRGRFLELGCFDGFIAEKVLQQGGKEVIGVDRLERALELTAARGVQTELADLDDAALNFADKHFDCVLAGEVLDYVYDPDAALQEIHRVRKPGGRLIITVPNLASLGNRVLLLTGVPPYNLEVKPSQGGYWRYFTFDTLAQVLGDRGFEVKSMQSPYLACPLIYLSFSRLPWLHGVSPPKPRRERHRLFFSRSLARVFPRLGDIIIALAEKPA